MSTTVAFPVQTLREHITGLEAAITQCLADPQPKPVHKLRTETRRVEALLRLLALVSGLPPHAAESARLRGALRKLRGAAGSVRDLDVQRRMLDDLTGAGERDAGEPSESRQRKTKPGTGERAALASQRSGATASSERNEGATALRARMGRKRDRAAAGLQHLLKHRQRKTTRAAEAYLAAVAPAEALTLPGPDLLRHAQAILARGSAARRQTASQLDEDELHEIRKAAKSARYIAEILPDDPALAEAAQRYEALQEAGGQWHDALELARAARRYLGKTHALTAYYREQASTRRSAYRKALRAQPRPARSAGGATPPPISARAAARPRLVTAAA